MLQLRYLCFVGTAGYVCIDLGELCSGEPFRSLSRGTRNAREHAPVFPSISHRHGLQPHAEAPKRLD